MIRNENGLFNVLERELKRVAPEPRTCVELYDLPEVRKLANSSNRVSDYLGNLWRKGKVVRIPAPRTETSAARWMYAWKAGEEVQGLEYSPNTVQVLGNTIMKRPNIEITENGNIITIDLPGLNIVIRTKS